MLPRALPTAAALLMLSACATTPGGGAGRAEPIRVKIIGLNDFHGALEPPGLTVKATTPDGVEVQVPAGGVAHLATAVAGLRAGAANSIVVGAGDLTGASPFASSQFLDEPSVLALDAVGLELNAVGNHEFDRGPQELLRLQNGGCERHTVRIPCRVDGQFPGARYRYLAANVRRADGTTLFPATALRSFGTGADAVKIGFIGLTLTETPTLVVPSAVAALRFDDEAETINALVPQLKGEGADAIVVLIHQGVNTKVGYNDKSCGGVAGNLLPILAKLDARVDVVVSGHTHAAYVCDYGRIDASRPLLLTSAGSRGMMVTDIDLSFDPVTRRLTDKRADNVIVQGVGHDGRDGPVAVQPGYPVFAADPAVGALVARYVAAAEPLAGRIVGRLAGPVSRLRNANGEAPLGLLVADAQKVATDAEIAFMNVYGLRADLLPGADGSVTYGQIYAVQPFGNVLQVKGMTGRQLRALLEQQFDSGLNTVQAPNVLQPSAGFAFTYDLRRPAGQRIVSMTLDGRAIADDRTYRVAVSNFLAAGGDNFTLLTQGTDIASGGDDIDALEAYLTGPRTRSAPAAGRVTRLDPPPIR